MFPQKHIDKNIEIFPLGDSAVTIQLGDEINLETHRMVVALAKYLDEHPFPGLIEYTPAFTTVTVFYDPIQLVRERKDWNKSPYEFVLSILEHLLENIKSKIEGTGKSIEIPVCYGNELGPDLNYVAQYNNLTSQEVIDIHSANEYLVYMIGFSPGFPYLGGMSNKIATPRRTSPRLITPAGSVGIAEKQTGIYSIETPGGWQIIGRTPLNLFQPNNDQASLLQVGDIVKFRPISYQQYLTYGGKAK